MRIVQLFSIFLLFGIVACSKNIDVGQACEKHDDCKGTNANMFCLREIGNDKGAYTCQQACSQTEKERDCLSGQSCIQAECIAPDAACWGICKTGGTTNPTCEKACAANEECKEGKCVPKKPTGGCGSVEKCPADHTCKDNKCVRNTSKETCETDRDCAEGLLCNRKTKKCGKLCKKDSDCEKGFECAAEFCQKIPDKPKCEKSDVRPPARAEMLGVFDAKRRRLVFWGGDDGLPVNCTPTAHPVGLTDLWIYDAACATFKKVDVSGQAPQGRARGMAVYDSDQDRMIIFGGRYRKGAGGPYTNFNDVWALDLKTLTWKQLPTKGGGPVARSNPAGAYNPNTKEMIVFGGNSSTSGLSFRPHNDVWALNLETNTWREITTSGPSKPSARLFHAATVDTKGNRLFVYAGGGANAWQGPFLRDLWVMDLKTGIWTVLDKGGFLSPLGRIWATITYDEKADRVLMYAGHDDQQIGNNNGTWSFDLKKKKWTALTPPEKIKKKANGFCNFPPDFTEPNMQAPDRRSAHLAALDNTRREWIVFGGKTDCGLIDDVWTFDLQRNGWIRLMKATKGESCIRGENPKLCVALCKSSK